MKRILLFTAVLLQGTFVLAQQQLENGSFENWEDLGAPEEEPTEWSSIKTSDAGNFINSSAPQVCWRSTDAHTGTYSVKLENKSVFGIVATGTVTNGRAHGDLDPENGYVFTDATDSKWNTSMSDRPDSLVGWYKYAPSSGDKAKAEAIIHSGAAQNPENGTASNFVARARFTTTSTASSWTRFAVPFSYYNSNASTHILLVLTSGDSTIAKAGSIAYFDDIELVYNPVSVTEIDPSKIQSYQNGSNVCIKLPISDFRNVEATIFDLQGRSIATKKNLLSGMNYMDLPKSDGIYLVSLNFNGKLITKKIVVTNN
jgi:hypothetical protein